MNKKEIISSLKSFLDTKYQNTSCFLHHNNEFQLLVAVVLSAQAKDEVVNKVTAVLFDKYKTIEELAYAKFTDVLKIIKIVGLGPSKAKNIIELSNQLITKYNSTVPHSREELVSLSGVGNKTASVIMAELFSSPCIPVDTHIKRVAYRIYLTKKDEDPYKIELLLEKNYTGNDHINFHRQIILFGRNICLSSSLRHCEECPLKCRERLKKFQNS